ncbi:MAG: peptide-methionine (R)-S-oxide reductase [Candidatus Nanopelagicales bacterium]
MTSCARAAPSGRTPASTPTPRPSGSTPAGPAAAELFRSAEKFHSHCGWPSFFSPAGRRPDRRDRGPLHGHGAHGGAVCRLRLAPRATCSPGRATTTPTDLRYCINSVSLKLEPAE